MQIYGEGTVQAEGVMRAKARVARAESTGTGYYRIRSEIMQDLVDIVRDEKGNCWETVSRGIT